MRLCFSMFGSDKVFGVGANSGVCDSVKQEWPEMNGYI